jgi:hypothetical protein
VTAWYWAATLSRFPHSGNLRRRIKVYESLMRVQAVEQQINCSDLPDNSDVDNFAARLLSFSGFIDYPAIKENMR